jgi:pyridoxine kinase
MACYVCPLPTAVLSTITGVFDGYQITDLTEQMEKTIRHWDTLDVRFDYIYSGFLGSPRQVDLILEAAERFSSFLLVDPVFADNGALYATMDGDMVQNMRRLVAKADMITPNFTETQYLLDDFRDSGAVRDMLKNLCAMGPKKAVITSVRRNDGMYVCAYDRAATQYIDIKCDYIPAACNGAGDVFTSVVLGAVARGERLEDALRRAADFVSDAVRLTVADGVPLREGLEIEKLLGDLRG